MPDQMQPARQKVGLILMFSALILAAVAGAIFAGVIPVAEDARGIAAAAMLVTAIGDFGVGLWFFRMGQSS